MVEKSLKKLLTCDENIVTFEISMNHGRWTGMEKMQSFENLTAPRFQDALFDLFEPLQVGLEGPWGHELGDQDDVFLARLTGRLLDVPVVVEPDDVGVL